MSQIPNDLIPLPTRPYDERPVELPLDVEECRTALWQSCGNISKAAETLKVPASRLRTFIKKHQRLQDEVEEAKQIMLDLSEGVVFDALTDHEDKSRQDQMARYVLTNLGGERGYGKTNGAVNLNLPKGNFTVTWGDGSSITANENNSDDAKVIEHE